MIYIDGTTALDRAILTETYKIHNLQSVKILIVTLPKTDFSFEEAIEKLKHAKTIINESEKEIITYYLDGMMTARGDEEFSYIWLFNPNVLKAKNPNKRIEELEKMNGANAENITDVQIALAEVYELILGEE